MKKLIIAVALLSFAGSASAAGELTWEVCTDRVERLAVIANVAESCGLNEKNTEIFLNAAMTPQEKWQATVCYQKMDSIEEGKVFIINTIVATQDVIKKTIAKEGIVNYCSKFGIKIASRKSM